MKPNRWIAIGLALVAAGSLVAAALSGSWLANPHLGQSSFGLRSCSNCCELQSGWTLYTSYRLDSEPSCTESNSAYVAKLRDLPRVADYASGAFAPTGWITFVACLLGAAGLVLSAAIAALGKTPALPMSPTTVALLAIMVALISGCVFVATKPGPAGFIGVAWGFWAFSGGAVAGIAGAQMLSRVLRPPDPDLLADAMNPDDFSA